MFMDAVTREILMQADSQMADIYLRRGTGGEGDAGLEEGIRSTIRHAAEPIGVAEALYLAALCMVTAGLCRQDRNRRRLGYEQEAGKHPDDP